MKRIALVLLLVTFLRFFSSFSISANSDLANNSFLERNNSFSEENSKNKNNISHSMVPNSEHRNEISRLQTSNFFSKFVNSNFKTDSKNFNNKKVTTAKIDEVKPNQKKDSNFVVNLEDGEYGSSATVYGKNNSTKARIYKILRSIYEKLGSNFFISANVFFFSNILFTSLIKGIPSSANKKVTKSNVFVLKKTAETKENDNFDLSNKSPIKIDKTATNNTKGDSFSEEKNKENEISRIDSEQVPVDKEKEEGKESGNFDLSNKSPIKIDKTATNNTKGDSFSEEKNKENEISRIDSEQVPVDKEKEGGKESGNFDLSNKSPIKIDETAANNTKGDSFSEEKNKENEISRIDSKQRPAGKEKEGKESLKQKPEGTNKENCLKKEKENTNKQCNILGEKEKNDYILIKFIFATILLLVIIYVVSRNYKKYNSEKIIFNKKNIIEEDIDKESLDINQINNVNPIGTPENNNKNKNFKISSTKEVAIYGAESKKKQNDLKIQNIDLNIFDKNIENNANLFNRYFDNLSINPQISDLYVKSILRENSQSNIIVNNDYFYVIPNKNIKNVIYEVDNVDNFSFFSAPKKREIKLTVKKSVKKESFTYKRFGNVDVSKMFDFSILPKTV